MRAYMYVYAHALKEVMQYALATVPEVRSALFSLRGLYIHFSK